MIDLLEAGVASSPAVPDRPLLFETKLRDLQPSGQTLPRPRLTDVLRASHGTLVLISAPPGFGKTTLLAQWRDVEDRTVASVSLDRGDNDASVFWIYVLEAIRRVEPRIGDSALEALGTPRPDLLGTVVPALAKELESFPEELVLVLDDLHAIESRAVEWTDGRPPRVGQHSEFDGSDRRAGKKRNAGDAATRVSDAVKRLPKNGHRIDLARPPQVLHLK